MLALAVLAAVGVPGIAWSEGRAAVSVGVSVGGGPAAVAGHGGPYHRAYLRPHPGWGWPYSFCSGWWYPPHPYDHDRPVVAVAYPAPDVATVELTVRPKKATLRVDGQDYGRARDYDGAWSLLYLAPGPHQLEFAREGFQTLRRTVDVRRGAFYRIREILQQGEGIDPRSDAPPAPSPAADEAPEQVAEPSVPRPAVARGLLRIRVWPEDAAVYLDDEFLAQGSELNRLHGALPVAPGVHRIEVVRPGYGTQTREVSVGLELAGSVEIRLEPR